MSADALPAPAPAPAPAAPGPGAEVAVRAPDGLPERMAFAQALAAAQLLPPAYRQRPANLLLADEYARALDLPLMAVVQGLHVIDGRPTASAQLIGALVRRAGHRLRVTDDGTTATAEVVRRDDPHFTFRATFSAVDADRAGLAGRDTWQRYPAAMRRARAITQVARDACPEALSGVSYTPDELDAPPGPDGATWTVTDLRADPGPSAPGPAAPEPPTPAPAGPEPRRVPGTVGRGNANRPATPAQLRGLYARLRRVGMGGHDDALALAQAVTGRAVAASTDLTMAEASRVLDVLAEMGRDDSAADRWARAAATAQESWRTPGEFAAEMRAAQAARGEPVTPGGPDDPRPGPADDDDLDQGDDPDVDPETGEVVPADVWDRQPGGAS